MALNKEYTYAELEKEPYWPFEKLRISITGAGGFIASHIVRRLKSEGHYIIASDWKKNEHMSEDMFCHAGAEPGFKLRGDHSVWEDYYDSNIWEVPVP